RVRHHAEHIPPRATDAGNIFQRSVWIGFGSDFSLWRSIAKHDAIVALELRERSIVTKVVTFQVANGDGENLALLARVSEGRICTLNSHIHRLADILQSGIAQ